jgi:hypothetical protein
VPDTFNTVFEAVIKNITTSEAGVEVAAIVVGTTYNLFYTVEIFLPKMKTHSCTLNIKGDFFKGAIT